MCWSPELGIFCAVGNNGTATSTDGVNWTTYAVAEQFMRISWSPELSIFAAISRTIGIAITSPNGTTWTTHSITGNEWTAICWSPELGIFCAVAQTGTGNRVITSSDGITWTTRSTVGADKEWRGVAWSPELFMFCAVAFASPSSDVIMTSHNGINWVTRTTPSNFDYRDITWSPELGIFAAVSSTGTGNRVMTSLPRTLEGGLRFGAYEPRGHQLANIYDTGNVVVSGTTMYYVSPINTQVRGMVVMHFIWNTNLQQIHGTLYVNVNNGIVVLGGSDINIGSHGSVFSGGILRVQVNGTSAGAIYTSSSTVFIFTALV
jgi:hypothetical protein